MLKPNAASSVSSHYASRNRRSKSHGMRRRSSCKREWGRVEELMVEDYLSEREQAEALREWWKENWRWIVGGVALGFALLIGWTQWNAYRDARAEDAAKHFEDVKAALAKQDVEGASRLLTELVAK